MDWSKSANITEDESSGRRDSVAGSVFAADKDGVSMTPEAVNGNACDPILLSPSLGSKVVKNYDLLRINSTRLWRDIHHTAQWGGIEGSLGMARIAASEEDHKVRDWFVGAAKSLGCEVRIDQIGNIFAILPGSDSGLAPIAVGSHLDTQPSGKQMLTSFNSASGRYLQIGLLQEDVSMEYLVSLPV